MLAVCWTRYACQGNGSWLRGDYASAARLAYWTPAAHVEGYQIRYRVKCLVLELVLGPLVHRFRLDHHLFTPKFVKNSSIFAFEAKFSCNFFFFQFLLRTFYCTDFPSFKKILTLKLL